MDTWQIILAIIIVGLSIIMPIYYSSEKKKKEQQQMRLLEGKEVAKAVVVPPPASWSPDSPDGVPAAKMAKAAATEESPALVVRANETMANESASEVAKATPVQATGPEVPNAPSARKVVQLLCGLGVASLEAPQMHVHPEQLLSLRYDDTLGREVTR